MQQKQNAQLTGALLWRPGSESSHFCRIYRQKPLLSQLDSPFVWLFLRAVRLKNLTHMRTGPVRLHPYISKKQNATGAFYFLEAWVGIEPAYKDLQSSA